MLCVHRSVTGELRALAAQHGIPWRAARLKGFYRPWVPDGGLAFDIGAGAGHRVRAWRALGARVVAVEPRAQFARLLQALFEADPGVSVAWQSLDGADPLREGGAAGDWATDAPRDGPQARRRSPAVRPDAGQDGSTDGARDARYLTAGAPDGGRPEARPDVLRGADGDAGSAGRAPDAPGSTTLDALVAREGRPDFVKLDLGGGEAQALGRLSVPLPALCFSLAPPWPRRVAACVENLERLGRYRYRVSAGERLRWLETEPLDADGVLGWLEARPDTLGVGGDIYARLA
jgi:hypothetical protein